MLKAFLDKLKGFKTVIVFGPIFLLSLLDSLNAVDLNPLLETLGVSDLNRASLLSAMSVLAIFLRIYTTSPILKKPE